MVLLLHPTESRQFSPLQRWTTGHGKLKIFEGLRYSAPKDSSRTSEFIVPTSLNQDNQVTSRLILLSDQLDWLMPWPYVFRNWEEPRIPNTNTASRVNLIYSRCRSLKYGKSKSNFRGVGRRIKAIEICASLRLMGSVNALKYGPLASSSLRLIHGLDEDSL